MKGCEPEDAALETLRAFLSEYCRKPDGIDIVRSDKIPVSEARGLSEKALARKYLNGPDLAKASQEAFLYVLFYHDALRQEASAANPAQAGASVPKSRRSKIAHPYADVGLYPAIYFNRRYFLKMGEFRGVSEKEALRHEAGHVLGLTRKPERAVGHHCPVRTCLMTATHRIRGDFHKPHWRLCQECVAELERSSNEPPLPNIRYAGPVLVRSEADYHVLSLPDRLAIIAGDLTDRDCQDFVRAVRDDSGGPDDGRNRIYCVLKTEPLKHGVKTSDIISRFKHDLLPDVRNVGPRVFLAACARRYTAVGQYSNAVSTLQQAISLDSKAPVIYNNLAWIKATCPEQYVRNGTEAVAAATKACELTQWKNFRFIDTLAAAYAEAGDFKRAIEFQERALRASDSTESQRTGMQERLALYNQSQPFRDSLQKPE